MEYHKLRLREVVEDDIFKNEAGQVRGKIDCRATPSTAFFRWLKQQASSHDGIAEVYTSGLPDARFTVRFDEAVSQPLLVLRPFVLEVDAIIAVKGAENNPVIHEWLHETPHEGVMAVPAKGDPDDYDFL